MSVTPTFCRGRQFPPVPSSQPSAGRVVSSSSSARDRRGVAKHVAWRARSISRVEASRPLKMVGRRTPLTRALQRASRQCAGPEGPGLISPPRDRVQQERRRYAASRTSSAQCHADVDGRQQYAHAEAFRFIDARERCRYSLAYIDVASILYKPCRKYIHDGV